MVNGGERGIRTLGAAVNSTHDFQSCTFSQLGHLSQKNFSQNFFAGAAAPQKKNTTLMFICKYSVEKRTYGIYIRSPS